MTDTTTEITELNAFELARYADVPSPDGDDTPGAQFLKTVAQDVADQIDNGYLDEDSAHEIADQCVPVYTHERWLTFVDLAAYQEDVNELADPSSLDLTEQAGIALYLIAHRLVNALLEWYADEEE